MSIRLLRRDFAPLSAQCAYSTCHRDLSGKTWVAEIEGEIRLFHTSCIQSAMGAQTFRAQRRHVPDLTTHDFSPTQDKEIDAIADPHLDSPGLGERRRQHAISYLVVRCLALPKLPKVNIEVSRDGTLRDIYKRYAERGALTPEEIGTVLQIEAATRQSTPLLSRANLMSVYAAHHQVKRKRRDIAFTLVDAKACPLPTAAAQAKRMAILENTQTFIDSVGKQLLRKLCLTPRQLSRLNLSLPADPFPPGMVYSARTWRRRDKSTSAA